MDLDAAADDDGKNKRKRKAKSAYGDMRADSASPRHRRVAVVAVFSRLSGAFAAPSFSFESALSPSVCAFSPQARAGSAVHGRAGDEEAADA